MSVIQAHSIFCLMCSRSWCQSVIRTAMRKFWVGNGEKDGRGDITVYVTPKEESRRNLINLLAVKQQGKNRS